VQHRGQQQFDLSSGSMEPRHDPALAAQYGQQSLPGLSQPSKQPRRQRQPDTGKQLPMFMSAREIKRQYQPLEGDIQSTYQEREGEATNRPFTTGGHPNRPIRPNDRSAPFLKRQGTMGQTATHYRDFDRPETHEELWGRKLEESHLTYDEYNEVHGGGGTGSSKRPPDIEQLWDRSSAPQRGSTGHTDTHDWQMHSYLERKMDAHMQRMNSSLHEDISHAMRPGGEGFKGVLHLATGQFGLSGKPEVAGGHHRIAIMHDIQPDRLLPVVHHEKFKDARNDPVYKYS
jgi:hypothetical protein